MHFIDFGEHILNVLYDGLQAWYNDNKRQEHFYLFVVLIAESRSILIVFHSDPKTVTLFDSHSHTADVGSVIVQTNHHNLNELCVWIQKLYNQFYMVEPKCFELSFIHAKNVNSK